MANSVPLLAPANGEDVRKWRDRLRYPFGDTGVPYEFIGSNGQSFEEIVTHPSDQERLRKVCAALCAESLVQRRATSAAPVRVSIGHYNTAVTRFAVHVHYPFPLPLSHSALSIVPVLTPSYVDTKTYKPAYSATATDVRFQVAAEGHALHTHCVIMVFENPPIFGGVVNTSAKQSTSSRHPLVSASSRTAAADRLDPRTAAVTAGRAVRVVPDARAAWRASGRHIRSNDAADDDVDDTLPAIQRRPNEATDLDEPLDGLLDRLRVRYAVMRYDMSIEDDVRPSDRFRVRQAVKWMRAVADTFSCPCTLTLWLVHDAPQGVYVLYMQYVPVKQTSSNGRNGSGSGSGSAATQLPQDVPYSLLSMLIASCGREYVDGDQFISGFDTEAGGLFVQLALAETERPYKTDATPYVFSKADRDQPNIGPDGSWMPELIHVSNTAVLGAHDEGVPVRRNQSAPRVTAAAAAAAAIKRTSDVLDNGDGTAVASSSSQRPAKVRRTEDHGPTATGHATRDATSMPPPPPVRATDRVDVTKSTAS